MVPYGDKSNYRTDKFAYPIYMSESKYAIGKFCYDGYGNYTGNEIYDSSLVNKIDDKKFNNLYGYAPAGTNCIGLTAQNRLWQQYSTNLTNGYALQYQDNYEDKLEIRVYSWTYLATRSGSFPSSEVINQQNLYNKNGNCSATLYHPYNKYVNKVVSVSCGPFISYKTTTDGQYYGMWPVFAV